MLTTVKSDILTSFDYNVKLILRLIWLILLFFYSILYHQYHHHHRRRSYSMINRTKMYKSQ